MKTIFSYLRHYYNYLMDLLFKRLWKSIPMILLFAFLFTFADFSVFAKINNYNTDFEEIHNYKTEEIELSEVESEYEITEKRTSNTKTFKKVNNSYELVMFGEDVHYLDNGKYEEIDNTLLLDGSYVKNKSNKFDVEFASELNKGLNNKLEYNNHIIQWKINNTNTLNSKAIINQNKIKYNNIFKDVNLEYIVNNNSVKENIELTKYIDNFIFSYTLFTDLRIERVGNKLELYNDEHKLIYTINEYFMYDANSQLSYDINFSVEQVKNNEYLITATPSDNFLKNASYPVIIDPEFVISNEADMGSINAKLFEPSKFPSYYPQYGLDYLTLTSQGLLSSKLYMQINFPSGIDYQQLLNSNILYSYLTLPYIESYCVDECSVNARIVESPWNQIIPNNNFVVNETITASYKLETDSSNIHRFDIFDFASTPSQILEFSLDGPSGSYVAYNRPFSAESIPEFRLGYMDEAGLSSYYTYDEFSTSNSSTSYVAHNSGNLTTIYNIYTDNNMINASVIYNSNRSHILSEFGYGFRLNYNEIIETLSESVITLTKGNGSTVSFSKTNMGEPLDHYLAMDGSGDKIYGTNGNYRLITKGNVEKIYNTDNKLYKIYPDIDDKTKYVSITFDYMKRIYEVYDHNPITLTYNTKIKFTYGSSVYADIYRKNEDNLEKLVEYTYITLTNSNLVRAWKYDNLRYTFFEACNFTYSNGKLETIKDDITNGMKFTFDKANRVKRLEQIIPNIIDTPYLDFTYDNNGRKLTVKDPNELKVIYTFDKYFHTKTITNTLGYTTFTEYEDIFYTPGGGYNHEPNYNKNHTIKSASQPFINNLNLISNHSFEILSPNFLWDNNSTGGTLSIEKEFLFGKYALRLNKTDSGTPMAGQDIQVKAGSSYIVTGYIKNTNTTGAGAYIDVTSNNPNSFIKESSSEAVKGDLEYTHYYVKFKALVDTTVTINLVNKSSGKAYFDMIQMNMDTIDLRNNYLNNSSFENGSLSWINSANYIADNDSDIFDANMMGNKYLKLKNGSVSQEVYVNGNKDDVFVYGASALFNNDIARGIINLTFNYIDGTVGSYEFSFDYSDKNIQYLMRKAKAIKDYSKITITITNTTHNKDVFIDNIALYKEGYGLQLTYNEDGDIEAAINEITNTNTEYEYEDGFIKTIKEDNIKTEVKRVDNTKWINYVVTNNIIQSFSYDVNGNLEELSLASKKIDPSDPNKYIPDIYLNSTSTIYTADKLYIDQKTDEYGRVTDFTFDYLTGLLKDTTFNGKTTSREYDSLQNLTKVTQGARSVEYVYEKKLLKEIKVDGLIYEFGYNNYKDVTSIKIAGTTVIENNYKDENTSKYSGLIEASSYGGDLLEFIYDKENRIKEVYVNGDMQIEYFYDSLGNISEVIDHKVDPSVTYYYNFDEENRLVTITSTDGNKVTYDYLPEDDGFLSSKTTINGKVDYNYISLDPDTEPEGKDKNKVISSESFINDAFSKEYNYQDSGLRKLDNTAIITSASTLTSKYTYDSFQKTVDGNVRFYETLRIKELDIKKNDVSLMRFVYSYDNYDNIKTILRYDNGSSYYSYYDYFDYNEYNELTYHAQIIGGIERINTYSYDLRGNIKTIYKVELQNGRQTSYSYITLTYEVSGWLDKLKSVTINGVTHYIDGYDVGNPNSYFNYNIMYEQRSIASIVSNDNFIELYFSYNANGIRTEKINNVKGVTTSYTLEGTRILKESRTDGKVLNYFYDQSGSIIGFKYNSNNYFYIKDLQNDIIGITNSNGNLIVTYVYDAYGSIVSINDTSGINLGVINPFRFKSYYFDEETKFYYLNSRYYDPLIGRFINADDIGMLAEGELNLFKYCDNNPVTGYDPMGTWNWGRFWKITGGVAGAAIAVTLVVATGGTALTLLSIGAGIAGYAVGSNIATVVESKHYVKHNDIASMPKDRYNEIVENMKTVGMSRDEKLSYIRYLKEKEPYNYRNWTEAQMMREFEYHDRGYALTSIFGNPFGFTNRFEKVDFEEDQKPCTYFYRTIGNMMFW